MPEVLSKISYTEIIKEALRYEPAASAKQERFSTWKNENQIKMLMLNRWKSGKNMLIVHILQYNK